MLDQRPYYIAEAHRKKALSADEEFFIQSVVDRGTKVPGNKFFQAFPQNVICTDAKVCTDQYGKPAIVYTHKDGIDGIARDLHDALTLSFRLRLNLELYNSNGIKPPTPDPITPTPKKTPKAEKKSSLTNTPLMQQYQEMKRNIPMLYCCLEWAISMRYSARMR